MLKFQSNAKFIVLPFYNFCLTVMWGTAYTRRRRARDVRRAAERAAERNARALEAAAAISAGTEGRGNLSG